MRRRQFAMLGAAGAGVPTFSRRGHAQRPQKPPRIGWLWPGHSTENPQELAGFRQGLKEFGYIDQQNVNVDYRFGEGHYDRLAGVAAELIQLRPVVLVASSWPILRELGCAEGTNLIVERRFELPPILLACADAVIK